MKDSKKPIDNKRIDAMKNAMIAMKMLNSMNNDFSECTVELFRRVAKEHTFNTQCSFKTKYSEEIATLYREAGMKAEKTGTQGKNTLYNISF